jgi:lysozyme
MANAVGEDRSDFQAAGQSWSASAFGFTKATEGASWQSKTFAGNWSRLKDEGKRRGAYHFFHPAAPAAAQALFFVNYVKANGGFGPGDMFACDAEIAVGADGMEVAAQRALDRMHAPLMQVPMAALSVAVSPGALDFCDAVAQLVGPRCPVVLYTYLSFLPNVAGCAKYPLWVADYSSAPPASVAPWHSWIMWQDAAQGGQGGGDHNYFHGDAAALARWLGSYSPGPVQVTAELPTLVLGDQDVPGINQAVGKMQALLKFVGTKNNLPAAAGITVDGAFGPGTLAAVEAAQAFYSIVGGNGQCGGRTWAHLIGG